jgi:hypothetical protein
LKTAKGAVFEKVVFPPMMHFAQIALETEKTSR